MGSHWGDEPSWMESDSESGDDEEERSSTQGEDDELHHLGAFHCLMLIDCGCPGMFDPCPAIHDINFPEDPAPPMDFVIQAAEGMVRSKIKSTMINKTGKRDAFGVLLYNTRCRRPVEEDKDEEVKEKEHDDDDDDHEDGHLLVGSLGTRASTVHEFIPLEPPGVSTVKLLRSVQDDPIVGREKSLEELYRPTQDDLDDEGGHYLYSENPIQTALSRAMEVFQSSKFMNRKTTPLPDTKQIWIFTSEDDPCKGNEQVVDVLKTSIGDAQEINVCIWPLPHGNVNGQPQKTAQNFDYTKFYDKVGAIAPFRKGTKDPEQPSEAEEFDLAAVIEDMQYRWKKTNKSFAVPLLLPNWNTQKDFPGIWLDIYRLIQVGKRPIMLHVHQETGRLLTKVEIISNSTGQILSKKIGGKIVERSVALRDRVMSYVDFGGERVLMSDEDKTTLKQASNANSEFASLILLGFKDEASIQATEMLGQAYFAYPNDDRIKGSRDAFAHLHASMMRKGVLAIGEMLSRKTSTSQHVAIWALPECVDEEGGVVTRPPGMMIVELPFEEEVRDIGTDAAVRELVENGTSLASPEVVDVFAKMVEKQSFTDVRIGENFDNANLTMFWDFVEHVALGLPIPARPEEIDIIPNEEAISQLVANDVELMIRLLPEDVKVEKPAAKRNLEPDDPEWETVYRKREVGNCVNAALAKKLKSFNEKVTGNKEDLVRRLLPHLQKEYDGETEET